MLDLSYDYKSCVKNSEKATWRLEEVMPEGTRLDFTRPFLPEKLAPTARVACLAEKERLVLNHITSNSYLNLFGFVEEYILAMAIKHAHAELFGDHDAIRALTRFADEEVKHQALFKRYRAAFDRDFGFECEVLDNAADVAGVILSKSPLAVVTVTLHLELMTQDHYTSSVRDEQGLDPFFCKLLKHHWVEESQHARIDALELDKMADASSEDVRSRAFADYLEIGGAFDGLLKLQAEMDVRTLARALGRTFNPDEVAQLTASQQAGYRYTFLVSGMRHKTFMDTVGIVFGPESAAKLAQTAAALS
jgi:hypothetical protein